MPSQNLMPVPDHLDDERAVFAEPLAAALQTARQLTIEGRPYITVLGESLSGFLTAKVLSRLNASVRLVGWQPEKLAPCDKWKIKHRPIAEVGRRADQDIVVECTGTAAGITEALRMVRPRGTVVLRSIEQLAALQQIDLTSIVLNELRMIGSWTGPLGEAIGMLEREDVDVLPLISRRMRLDDGIKIMRVVADPAVTAVLVEV